MNGVFSPEQREVYNMVLETQIRVIDRVYPGVTLQDLQKYAIRSICDHLRQFGYLNASLVICQDESLFYYFYPQVSATLLALMSTTVPTQMIT